MSYGADVADTYRRAANDVDRDPEGNKASRHSGRAADEV